AACAGAEAGAEFGLGGSCAGEELGKILLRRQLVQQ
ncbi:unnamed protein product, partial [Urochloa humidicola]